jgi:hypothetical protein
MGSKVGQPFSVIDRLADSDDPRLVTAQELKALCSELELHGAYQILAWRRDADRGGQIEIIISYETPR